MVHVTKVILVLEHEPGPDRPPAENVEIIFQPGVPYSFVHHVVREIAWTLLRPGSQQDRPEGAPAADPPTHPAPTPPPPDAPKTRSHLKAPNLSEQIRARAPASKSHPARPPLKGGTE